MDMQYFSPVYGLVTSLDTGTENGGTFFLYYLVLKQMNNIPLTEYDFNLFHAKMNSAKVADGLYLRSAGHPVKTVSHDEITAMIATSAILNTSHGANIATYLKDNNGNYPATGEPKRYNPSNYFAWYNLANVKGHTFFPAILYFISMVISCNRPKQETSSKLLYLAELYTLRNKFPRVWKYYTNKMKKQYGQFWVKELFAIYFHTETPEYPLLKLSSQIQVDV